MRHILVGMCLLVLSTLPALSAEGFSCGGADIQFNFAKRQGGDMEGRVEAIISVSRDGRSTVLRYDGNIDFIGAICARDGRDKPMIVFQAYCGGSGCHDLDNWGIIDPRDLRVRLVPNDWNRRDAEKILGAPIPVVDSMISIGREAKKLGLE